jgi:phosphate transport system permease protein
VFRRAFTRIQLGRGADDVETGPEEGERPVLSPAEVPPPPGGDPATARLEAQAALAKGGVVPPVPADPPEPRTPYRLPTVSRGRIVRSNIWEGLVWFTLLFGLVPLVLVLYEMLSKGIPAITPGFFTELPPLDPNATGGGISNALVGTLIMMGLATAFAAPLGLLAALFTAEVGQTNRILSKIANGIGFFVDILLGVPSVVVGLTVYLGIVVVQGNFSALAGAIALAVIMFPIVVRSCDEILRLVPNAHKEAALALGSPRWRVTWSVILPTALPGILTGIILAMARGAGETAPLLFTSLGNQFFSTSLTEPIAAIPQLIYYNTITIQTDASIQLAWGAALVLVGMILILNVIASILSSRMRTESR